MLGDCAGSGTQEVPNECCLLMKEKGGEEAAPITWCYQAAETPLSRGPNNAPGVSHVCASAMPWVDAFSELATPVISICWTLGSNHHFATWQALWLWGNYLTSLGLGSSSVQCR